MLSVSVWIRAGAIVQVQVCVIHRGLRRSKYCCERGTLVPLLELLDLQAR